jgi:hypothetical protein
LELDLQALGFEGMQPESHSQRVSRVHRAVVERAMGIEPTGAARSELENKQFGAMAHAKCD